MARLRSGAVGRPGQYGRVRRPEGVRRSSGSWIARAIRDVWRRGLTYVRREAGLFVIMAVTFPSGPAERGALPVLPRLTLPRPDRNAPWYGEKSARIRRSDGPGGPCAGLAETPRSARMPGFTAGQTGRTGACRRKRASRRALRAKNVQVRVRSRTAGQIVPLYEIFRLPVGTARLRRQPVKVESAHAKGVSRADQVCCSDT